MKKKIEYFHFGGKENVLVEKLIVKQRRRHLFFFSHLRVSLLFDSLQNFPNLPLFCVCNSQNRKFTISLSV